MGWGGGRQTQARHVDEDQCPVKAETIGFAHTKKETPAANADAFEKRVAEESSLPRAGSAPFYGVRTKSRTPTTSSHARVYRHNISANLFFSAAHTKFLFFCSFSEKKVL